MLLPYTFLKAGNFESIAQVDTKNVVPETNEANNIQILPVTVLAAGIDLSISEHHHDAGRAGRFGLSE